MVHGRSIQLEASFDAGCADVSLLFPDFLLLFYFTQLTVICFNLFVCTQPVFNSIIKMSYLFPCCLGSEVEAFPL